MKMKNELMEDGLLKQPKVTGMLAQEGSKDRKWQDGVINHLVKQRLVGFEYNDEVTPSYVQLSFENDWSIKINAQDGFSLYKLVES